MLFLLKPASKLMSMCISTRYIIKEVFRDDRNASFLREG